MSQPFRLQDMTLPEISNLAAWMRTQPHTKLTDLPLDILTKIFTERALFQCYRRGRQLGFAMFRRRPEALDAYYPNQPGRNHHPQVYYMMARVVRFWAHMCIRHYVQFEFYAPDIDQ